MLHASRVPDIGTSVVFCTDPSCVPNAGTLRVYGTAPSSVPGANISHELGACLYRVPDVGWYFTCTWHWSFYVYPTLVLHIEYTFVGVLHASSVPGIDTL